MKYYLLKIRHWLLPKGFFAVILNLILTRANLRQWYLNVGSYFLRKGVGYEIGQITKKETLNNGVIKVRYIRSLSYDFKTNKVTHTLGVKNITKKDAQTR